MGSVDVTLDELLRKRSGSYPLGRKGHDGGSLVVESVELVARPSFLDYIKGGCEIAFSVRRVGSPTPLIDHSRICFESGQGLIISQSWVWCDVGPLACLCRSHVDQVAVDFTARYVSCWGGGGTWGQGRKEHGPVYCSHDPPPDALLGDGVVG